MKSKTEMQFNGWTNYETWLVSLWIGNDEKSYRHWTNRCREICRETECRDNIESEQRHEKIRQLAQEIKQAIYDECQIRKSNLAADLMNAALEEVNWWEIAEDLIEASLPSPHPDDDELIHSYSRAEALADGVLVDVTDMAKEAGLSFPVALTSGVHAKCVCVPPEAIGQDEPGRLWDLLTMLRHAIRRCDQSHRVVSFEVFVRNDHQAPKPIQLKCICGPDDDRSPCLTVMFPNED